MVAENTEGKTYFGNLTTFYSLLYTSAAVFFIGLALIFTDSPEFGLIFILVASILIIITFVLFYIVLYRIWKFVIIKENELGITPSIPSAGQAVGYLFIPFFNFYWLFKAIGKLPSEINAVANQYKLNKLVSYNLGYIIAALSIIGLIPYVGYVTAAINYLILLPLFIKNCVEVCQLIDQSEESPEKTTEVVKAETFDWESIIGIKNGGTSSFGSLPFYRNFLFSGLFVFLIGLVLLIFEAEETGVFVLLIGLAVFLVGIFYFYVLLFRVWKFVISQSRLKGLTPSIETHREAVGFLFIPLFSFYWVFMGIGKLPKDLNALAKSYDIQKEVSQEHAYGIAVLSVLSVIPYLGFVTSPIVLFILQPIFIHRAVQLCEFIIAEKNLTVELRTDYAPIKNYWESLTEFSQLFNTEKFGINYFVGIGMFAGLMLNRIIGLILQSPLSIYYYSSFEHEMIGISIDIVNCILFVIVTNVFAKNQLLPLIWGAIILATSLARSAIIRQTFDPFGEGLFRTSIFEPVVLINNFLLGFTFMFGLVYSIKIWGAKFWSLIIGLISGYIIYKILGIAIDVTFYSPELYIDIASYDLLAILNKAVLALTIYFGFYFHFKQNKFKTIFDITTD